MKLYVDELPNSCERCPFHDRKYGICDISGLRVEYFGCHSLTPLSDYDKQVRNEVCEEIRKKADIKYYEEYNGFDKKIGKTYIIRDYDLNQIQGGKTNDRTRIR